MKTDALQAYLPYLIPVIAFVGGVLSQRFLGIYERLTTRKPDPTEQKLDKLIEILTPKDVK